MLAEIRAENPDLNVEILGVNMLNDAIFNSLVTSQRSLPWLQETAEANVWSKWGVTWRDVRIIDSRGQLHAVYNLTAHDLGSQQNRATLKQLFLSAAKVVDSDGDQLPDDWELQYFGSLDGSAATDSDGDGDDNFREFALGTDPRDPKSRAIILPRISGNAGQGVLSLTLRRRSGAFLDYSIAELSDLNLSSANQPGLAPAQELRNLFDGTGAVEGVYSVPAAAPQKFIRVRAVRRQQAAPVNEAGGPER